MTEITSKPDHGEQVMSEDVASSRLQLFYDDIEQSLNNNLLGDSVLHTIYLANQTPSALPEANQNVGGIIMVTGLSFLEFSAPAYSAISKPGVNVPISITSVTNVGGIAQFNHILGTLENAREVIIFNYVTNPTYNGTFKISDSGNGFFRINSIDFTGDETGGEFIFGADWRLMDLFVPIIVV